MATFHLQIVTPLGMKFDDDIERIILRTVNGDVGIMKGHIGYLSPVNAGQVKINQNGISRFAVASEGFIRVSKDITTLVATSFEWANEIDVDRANKSLEKAKAILSNKASTKDAIANAKERQNRANTRIMVSNKK